MQRAQLKAAEASIHKLREEAAKTKVLVAQTRSSCANEVRKRDRQIDGLKKAVSDAGRARGATKNPGITTITVTGEIGSEGDHGTPRGGTDSDSYDLRMETNAFLAELAKGLSEENETLLSLLRKMNQRLKEMSGWDKEDGAHTTTDGHTFALPSNPDEMAGEIDSVLDHLRTILTNPSFVPIEEVVVREEEINRLRDGWEKMESRWKEAVHLIDGWKRRMQVDGRPVNVEELEMGLRLSPVRVRDVEETSMGFGLRLPAVQEETEEPIAALQSPCPLAESLHLVPAPEYEEPDVSDSESSVFEDDDLDIDQFDVEEPNVQILQQSTMFDSPPLPSPPQLTALRDSPSAANRGASAPTKKSRPGDFTTILEEDTYDVAAADVPLPPEKPAKQPQTAAKKQPRPAKAAVEDDMPPPPQAAADISASNNSSPDAVMLVKPVTRPAPKPSTTTTTRAQPRPISKQQNRLEPTPVTRRPVKQPPRPAATRGGRPANPEPEQPTQTTTTSAAAAAAAAKSTRTVSGSSTATTSSTTSTSTTLTSTTNNTSARSIDMPPPPLPPSASGNSNNNNNRSPRRANSRLPLPRTAGQQIPPPPQSPLTMTTIAAKLAASEREANAARVRAKLKAATLGRQPPASAGMAPPRTAPSSSSSLAGSGSGSGADESTGVRREERGEEEASQPAKKNVQAAVDSGDDGRDAPAEAGGDCAAADLVLEKPRKRDRRANKVASRRRSTLNSRELESLINGEC